MMVKRLNFRENRKPVKKIFDAFYMVYKGLESLTGCDVAKVKARDIPVMNKAPFTLSFSSPTFFISAGWKFDYGVKIISYKLEWCL